MMTTLKDLDKSYILSVEETYNSLEKAYYKTNSDYKFDLSKREITEAILERLKTYYITQNKIKILLDKRYIAAASDFFVESTLYFLRLYLKSKGENLIAHSEKQIKRTKNSIRPDISIWKNDEVIAIIECKTQLGWNRNNWEAEYEIRDQKLKNVFPNAKSFLLVMTGINWNGFGDHIHLGKNFFCLVENIWPNEYNSPIQILTPIEQLFNQI